MRYNFVGMNVKIAIKRKQVMGIVEGISVIISQHNGGTPSFEQLWASESEGKKLDIYYREAVSDLEKRLTEWLSESSGQFDLSASGTDYTLTLKVHRFWPKRLKGLLCNKVQDYLVHSITAGWLNDFDGISTKQDYLEMAGTDQSDIRDILIQKDFNFSEAARASDADKSLSETDADAGARKGETDKAQPDKVDATAARASDADKSLSEADADAGARMGDRYKSNSGSDDVPTGLRTEDREHKGIERTVQTYRRHEDDARVCHEPDFTDWSGTHFGIMAPHDRHTDVVNGRRIYPHHDHHDHERRNHHD